MDYFLSTPLRLLAELGTALLGVEVVVPTPSLVPSVPRYARLGGDASSPLVRPVHDEVPGDGGDGPVEEAAVEAPPDVEDGVVGRAGERVLPVGRDAERDDTLLGLAAYLECELKSLRAAARAIARVWGRVSGAKVSRVGCRCVVARPEPEPAGFEAAEGKRRESKSPTYQSGPSDQCNYTESTR